MTVLSSSPWSSRNVANACLKSWRRTNSWPAPYLMREAGPLASLVKGSAAAAAGGSALVLPDHPFGEVYWQIVRPPVRRRPNC
jgi:hypothetical protein